MKTPQRNWLTASPEFLGSELCHTAGLASHGLPLCLRHKVEEPGGQLNGSLKKKKKTSYFELLCFEMVYYKVTVKYIHENLH